jgi:hypothetical protein
MGGLEGPGTLWATLQETSFPLVVGGKAAYNERETDIKGRLHLPTPLVRIAIKEEVL